MDKPINCRCGGEAEIIFDGNGEMSVVAVKCKKCGITTTYYLDDAQKAIHAWNRAMGTLLPEGDPQKNDGCECSNTTERTAKVEHQYRDYLPYDRFMEYELRGNCEKCGETVWKGEKYCHECGARLEWEE